MTERKYTHHRYPFPCFLLIPLFSLIAGCATTVDIPARIPATNTEAASLRKIAVADFYGPDGDRFAYELEAALASVTFDTKPYFTLTDSGQRNNADTAQRAVAYGRRVGAQGVYFGQIMTADMHRSPYETSEKRCVEWDKDKKCTRKAAFRVFCMRQNYDLTVLPSLVRVADGRVVYASHKNASASTSWCEGEPRPLSDDDLVESAMEDVLAEIRTEIAPYNTVLHATVNAYSDGLPPDSAARFDAAVRSARKGDVSDACRQWGEIDQANPGHAATVYNLGVCAETSGDYNKALTQYERARTLTPTADSTIAEAIRRATGLRDARRVLRKSPPHH